MQRVMNFVRDTQNHATRGWSGRQRTMARTTLHGKFHIATQLLLGLRHPEVQEQLAPYGLTEETIDHGWELVVAIGRARRGHAPEPSRRESRRVYDELDALKRAWFPVVRGVLRAHFPAEKGEVTATLSRERAALPFMMAHFLARMRDMEHGAPPFGPAGPELRRLLATRGFTAEIEETISQTLDQWRNGPELPLRPDTREAALKAEEQAVAELWTFYLDWSAVASRHITESDRRRWLGLSSLVKKSRKAAGAKRAKAERIELCAVVEKVPLRLLP